MADRLKGITVEIAGDTTGLNKALKNVNQESRSLQSELSDVERLLKFNPDNAELLAQKQQLLNRQIETTSNKLSQLKQAEHQVQQQFERGDIGADQFRAFQREIIATEGRLHHFQGQAQETSHKAKVSFKDMGSGIANGIAGAVAGAGIGTVISKALETAALDTKIKLSFDVDDAAIPKIKGIISTIQAYGVESETALEGVRKQFALNGDLSEKENQKIIESAAVISKAYADIDFTELIQESNEFGDAIGISQQDALAMTNTLLKLGFPPDQLDIMSEYGAQLHRAGYNAQEIQGIFAAGVETKSWNIDILLDGVKEGRIRLAEFGVGVDKTTAGLIKGTNISAKQLQEWGTAVAEGGDAGKVAFGEVATQLGKVKDSTQRNAIGTRLFGTLWEEQGKKITDSLAGANTKTGDLKKNQDALNKSVDELKNDPQVRLNTAISDMMTELRPLLTAVAEFVAKVADWAAKNPELTATIVAVTVGLGIMIGLALALIPVIVALTAADWGLIASLLPIVLPILAIVAAIAAVIAIGVLLYKNWGVIKTKARQDFNDLLVTIKGVMNRISSKWNEGIQDIKDGWHKVTKFFKDIDLVETGKKIIGGLITGIKNKAEALYTKAKEIADNIKNTIEDVLKPGSPSKVTMKIGEDTGDGLAVGLEHSISKVNAVSTKLAKAATPHPAATINNSQTIGGKSMTMNFHSPKAIDVREANKEFKRTFNKMSLMW
jgi:phage-related minor tail protein